MKLQGTWHWGLWYFWMFVQLSWAQNQVMHKTFGIFQILGLHIRNRFLKTQKKVKNCGRSISWLNFTRFLMVPWFIVCLSLTRSGPWYPIQLQHGFPRFSAVWSTACWPCGSARATNSGARAFAIDSQEVVRWSYKRIFFLKILSGNNNNESLQRVIDLGYRIDCQSMSCSIRMLSNEGASTREEHEPQIADVLA